MFSEIEKRCLDGLLGNQILISKDKIVDAYKNRKDQDKVSIIQNQKNEDIVVVKTEKQFRNYLKVIGRLLLLFMNHVQKYFGNSLEKKNWLNFLRVEECF